MIHRIGGHVIRRAVVNVAFVWSAELILARLTSGPQSLADVGLSFVVLMLLGPGSVALLQAVLPESRGRRALASVAGMAPLGLVVFGILFPALPGGIQGLSMAGAMAAGLVVWRFAAGVVGRDPAPSPVESILALAGACVVSWMMRGAGLPPWEAVASIAGLFTLAAAATYHPAGNAALWVGTVVLALVPPRAVEPSWPRGSPTSDAPDIVLIVIDTLRADDAGSMRSYRRIADEGVAFARAQAAAPWTVPSMGALLTGARPSHHGAVRRPSDRISDLNPDLETLPERLLDAGFDTAAVLANPVVDTPGFRRGFATFWSTAALHRWSVPRGRSTFDARPSVALALSTFELWGRPSTHDAFAVTRVAEQILSARRPDHPVFLWVHYMDCHTPYRHALDSGLALSEALVLDVGRDDTLREEDHWRSPKGIEAMREAYRYEVRQVDRSIGSLLDFLEPPPARGRIRVFVSDHGEEFLDHGALFHGHSLYQELLGVPLVISGLPGADPGSLVEEVVGHVDLAPTLLAAAGLPSDGLEGRNLAEEAGGGVYVSRNLTYGDPDRWVAVRHGRWKLLKGHEGEVELYDLDADPSEGHSLASSHPEVVARLERAIKPMGHEGRSPEDLPDEHREALRALGYLE